MVKLLKYLLLIFISFNSFSQNSEFKVYENGLIYSDFTINKLKKCVDSLELKYKNCQSQNFNSVKQSIANFVVLEKTKVKEAKKDMDAGMPFDDFIKKYAKAKVESRLPVTAFTTNDYDNPKSKRITISNVEIGDYDNHSINVSLETFGGNLKGKWVYDYAEKDEYSDESISAFYLIENFNSNKLAEKYAKLIQYSECMIDTTSSIFHEGAIKTGVSYYDSIPNKITKFNEYIEIKLKKPSYDEFDKIRLEDDFDENFNKKKRSKKEQREREKLEKIAEAEFEKFFKKMEDWESKRLMRIDSLKRADNNFEMLFNEAYEDALKGVSANDEFEELVGIYISKQAALELKRKRRVVGGCSMDQSPRIHAKNIAILSAETAKWEVFLKSHLNIMNDRFERVSDGSYAYGGRNTYIKELEVLDINVPDLIFGTALRFENPTKNHYYASINRIGRALSESKDRKLIENRLLEYIEDNNLDDFNRVIMYYLYLNYNSYLENDNDKKESLSKLKNSVSKMPDYIYEKMKFN